MIQNNNSNKITSLTLITSESCNLQCKYCDMASHINRELHSLEAKKVKESLTNGQYINTIKKSFNRLNINPEQITHFELWGQEPTLTLKEFETMFVELYQYCNNLNSMMFSTNGVGFIDSIIHFINKVKNTVNKYFKISIQFSYDGKFATKNNRGIDSEIILNNINKLITNLNQIDLGKIEISIYFHNVIDNNIINYYSKEDKKEELYQFLLDFSNLSEKFINLNTNPAITIGPFSPGLITPYNASVQEGKNLYQFYRNCQEVDIGLKYSNYIGLTHQFYRRFTDIDFNDNLKFLQDLNNFYYFDKEHLTTMSPRLSCGFNYGTLKVRYDGTLIVCQNAIMGLNEEELNHRTDSDAIIQRRKILKNFYPNILTDSDEIINDYLYEINALHEESFLSAYSQVANLMTLLLHAKQIDAQYNNPNKFLQAAYDLTLMVNCPYNGMMQSSNFYGKYAGYIRFLCNGFLDIIYEEAQKYMNTHKKGYPDEYN